MTLEKREFICTTNSWHEIWSLSRTVHPETDCIYYERIFATSAGVAKADFARMHNCAYVDVRCRLRKSSELHESL